MNTLLGRWRLVRGEYYGMPIPSSELPRGLIVTFADGRVWSEAEAPGDTLTGDWSADVAREPMALDIVHTAGPDEGARQPCIFAIAHKRLSLAFGVPGGGEETRPTGFDTAGHPGAVFFEFEALESASPVA